LPCRETARSPPSMPLAGVWPRRQAGGVMAVVKKDLRPRRIASCEAFRNAIAVDMALGCSTNTVLHLPAIAHEAGITLDLDLFHTISERTRTSAA